MADIMGFQKRQERMCGSKKKFKTHREASLVAFGINTKNNDNLSVYLCPYCNMFHLGHDKGTGKSWEEWLNG